MSVFSRLLSSWRCTSSGMLYRIDRLIVTGVSEDRKAFVFVVKRSEKKKEREILGSVF